MFAIGDPPVLLTVAVCGALGTPGCWLVKVRLEGLTLKAGGASPVPLNDTVCVRKASAMVSVPGTAPTWVGAKIALMVQTAPAASCVPHVFDSWNCALAEMEIEVSGRPPEFVIVTDCAEESWPSGVGGK